MRHQNTYVLFASLEEKEREGLRRKKKERISGRNRRYWEERLCGLIYQITYIYTIDCKHHI